MMRGSLYLALLLCNPFVVFGRQSVRFRSGQIISDEIIDTQVESIHADSEDASSFLQPDRELHSFFTSDLVCPTGSDLDLLCEDFVQETALRMRRMRPRRRFMMMKTTMKKKMMNKKKKNMMMKKKKNNNDDSVRGKGKTSKSKSSKSKMGKGKMSKSKTSKSKMKKRRTDELNDMELELDNANRLLKTTVYIIDDDATDDDAIDDDATDDASDDNVTDDQVVIDDTLVGDVTDDDDPDATYLDALMEKCCIAVTDPIAPTTPTAPTAPTTGFLEEGPQISAPSPAPSPAPVDCDVTVADGGSDAYVYCPGKSMCFLDTAFNGGVKASGWGFNIAYDALKDGNLEGCQIWMGVRGCDLSTGVQVGTATITPDLFHFCLNDEEFTSNSFQLYAGKCVSSDAGLHTQNSGICQSSAISVFANKPQKFPMVSNIDSFTSTYTFDQSDSINANSWSGYDMFPLGAGARKFIVAHCVVYPVVKVTPPSAAPSDVFVPDATVPPTRPPISTTVAPVPVVAPVLAVAPVTPISVPVAAPVVQITVPVAAPVVPISAPFTAAPLSAPFTATPLSAPFTAAPLSAPFTAAPLSPVTVKPISAPVPAPFVFPTALPMPVAAPAALTVSTVAPKSIPILSPTTNVTTILNATSTNVTGGCP